MPHPFCVNPLAEARVGGIVGFLMMTGGGLNLGRCTFTRRQWRCRFSNCGCVCSTTCPSLSLLLRFCFSQSSGPSLMSLSHLLSPGRACVCCLLAFLASRVCGMGGVGERPRLLVLDVWGALLLPWEHLVLCQTSHIECRCCMGEGRDMCHDGCCLPAVLVVVVASGCWYCPGGQQKPRRSGCLLPLSRASCFV